jgi:hypothetical protein
VRTNQATQTRNGWLAILTHLDDALRALPSPRSSMGHAELEELALARYELCGLFRHAYEALLETPLRTT